MVFAEPLASHFALSVMTDSLAASFTTAGVAALVRIAVLGDTRPRTGIAAGLAIGAAGFMRAEKVEVFALVIAVTLAIFAARRHGETRRPHRLQQPAATGDRDAGDVAAGAGRGRARAQPGDPDRRLRLAAGDGEHASVRAQRLAASGAIRPLLSADAQAVVSAADAERFDGQYNEFLSLVPRLQRRRRRQRSTGRSRSRVVALASHGAEIAVATAADALRYTAPMIAYPVDLVVGSHSASAWTDSRMRMAHPSLTRAYVAIATAVLVIVQLPLLTLALVRRGARDPHIVGAACLTVGTALVNAVLYALGNGLQNVRYALPGYVLVYAVIVWANLAVLATAWYASAPTRAVPTAMRSAERRDRL